MAIVSTVPTTRSGWRFDPQKVLLDPYGRAVVVPKNTPHRAHDPGDNSAAAMKSVVADTTTTTGRMTSRCAVRSASTIIYEMHVRGFTRNPNSGAAGEKSRNLRWTDRQDPLFAGSGYHSGRTIAGVRLRCAGLPARRVNYWGYAPLSFFAPHPAYSSRQDPLGPLDEFRDMVKALHRAGIEVILDVVFNHTAEGNHDGPTVCFRGIDNPSYYMLSPIAPGIPTTLAAAIR